MARVPLAVAGGVGRLLLGSRGGCQAWAVVTGIGGCRNAVVPTNRAWPPGCDGAHGLVSHRGAGQGLGVAVRRGTPPAHPPAAPVASATFADPAVGGRGQCGRRMVDGSRQVDAGAVMLSLRRLQSRPDEHGSPGQGRGCGWHGGRVGCECQFWSACVPRGVGKRYAVVDRAEAYAAGCRDWGRGGHS